MAADLSRKPKISESWATLLGDEFEQDYMQSLAAFLRHEKAAGKTIYPPGDQIFSAFNSTDVQDVKVVIIGQDPYHGPGQAHGLCFSVLPGIDAPPSLKNICQEMASDLGGAQAEAPGSLAGWAAQGVLLLNSVLTVEHSLAASHQGRGWERFTDGVVAKLSAHRSGLVYLLWGSYAQKKGAEINRQTNCVLTAPHPSPLSAYRGFFGCRHFSKANDYIVEHGGTPIQWLQMAANEQTQQT
ncbi:MAG: uracil-DNA glycosylase [Limisphaerales bacterium]|jgi:uracil-DNA glycosylase